MAHSKVIVITCNWNAFSGLETAGAQRLGYSVKVMPLKVMCLGQITQGIILKTFEKGADGILMLGCPPDSCHFEFGNRRAEEIFTEAKNLATLLGYRDEQLQLDWLSAGDGQGFVEKVERFMVNLNTQKVRT
jgi:F420-non-reducing hydrogenase iron-sulfur subunit